MVELRGRVWRAGVLQDEGVDIGRLPDLLAEQDVLVWLDLYGPSPADLESLAARLGLDPHSVEDALARRERPKATRHPGHTFVTAYATRLEAEGPRGYASRLELTRVSAFVLPNALVTVRAADDASTRYPGLTGTAEPAVTPNGFDIDEAVARWDDNADLLTVAGRHGVGVLLHGLLDAVVDGHFETIQALDDAVESLEDLLFDDTVQTRLVQGHVYRLRKELVELRRVVLPMREVVNAVLRHRADANGSQELDGWYDDLYDHVLRASEWTESLRDMIATLFETNLSLQDAHLNTVMKKLAGWAAIIAVPTAVTGWFGQNVPYPGFGDLLGVWQSLVLILCCSLVLYVLFRRRDWI